MSKSPEEERIFWEARLVPDSLEDWISSKGRGWVDVRDNDSISCTHSELSFRIERPEESVRDSIVCKLCGGQDVRDGRKSEREG